MRIAIATDAWHPQVNGVVRTLAATLNELLAREHEVELITPARFRTVPMPGYSEIRLAVAPQFGTWRTLADFAPDVIHVATEGPIGWTARAWARRHGIALTSAFHTRFPDYASIRTGIGAERFWPLMKRFHAPSQAVLVSNRGLAAELTARGIGPCRLWSRGIDRGLFRPDGLRHPALAGLTGPIMLNVGRVAAEKNLEAFCAARVPGTKVVIGDGPARGALSARFSEVRFLGPMEGEELASAYRAADVFVFPSLSDTFGIVMIEALACGLPVAAFPIAGPRDVLGDNGRGPDNDLPMTVGALAPDLAEAIGRALTLDRMGAAVYGAGFGWDRATDQFEAALTEAVRTCRTPVPA